MVNIVSLNVNGLRDSNKFQKLCKYCSENYFDVVGIQETFWDDDIVHDFEKYWDGEILYSCSNIARQGVAFLVSNRVKNDVTLVQIFDGRCIHIKIQIEDLTLNIVNCYAPNIVSNRSQFFELLMNKLTNLENLVLIGDTNTSMSKLDRSGKALHIEDKAYKSLTKISEQFNIYDIFGLKES
ncbi:E3.1.11.2 [Mytilus coruscus]|uniref:exodeoxyribonuclease III n=1 Tax=Mytilus coruscus TaxID=42192 RepID=A0A6J8AQ09_MYTCO|nr:E3.1.11.2 [Mytilus coruscus]